MKALIERLREDDSGLAQEFEDAIERLQQPVDVSPDEVTISGRFLYSAETVARLQQERDAAQRESEVHKESNIALCNMVVGLQDQVKLLRFAISNAIQEGVEWRNVLAGALAATEPKES